MQKEKQKSRQPRSYLIILIIPLSIVLIFAVLFMATKTAVISWQTTPTVGVVGPTLIVTQPQATPIKPATLTPTPTRASPTTIPNTPIGTSTAQPSAKPNPTGLITIDSAYCIIYSSGQRTMLEIMGHTTLPFSKVTVKIAGPDGIPHDFPAPNNVVQNPVTPVTPDHYIFSPPLSPELVKSIKTDANLCPAFVFMVSTDPPFSVSRAVQIDLQHDG